MKATTLLIRQHNEVKAIFKKLEDGTGDAHKLREELANDLAAHMAIEQDTFYPAVLELKPDLVEESFEEHAVAEFALKRLLSVPTTDRTFKAKVTTLKELIEHHVEEEENDLFPAVEKALGEEKLQMMGKQMEEDFDKEKAAGFSSLLPNAMSQTTADPANGKRSPRTVQKTASAAAPLRRTAAKGKVMSKRGAAKKPVAKKPATKKTASKKPASVQSAARSTRAKKGKGKSPRR